MDNFVLNLDYYFNNKKNRCFNSATPNESVASHVDHLFSIFSANAIEIKNKLTNKLYFFKYEELKKNCKLTLGELINLKDKENVKE